MTTAEMTAAEMAALHAACFSVPRPWSASEFARYQADPMAIVLTEATGLLIGRVVAGEAELLTLAVAPGARRAGLGRLLVLQFLVEAGRRGAERAFLEVAADNEAALALYHLAGFQPAGRRRGYYQGRDALVLFRALVPRAPEV